jgi:hypothetical protein
MRDELHVVPESKLLRLRWNLAADALAARLRLSVAKTDVKYDLNQPRDGRGQRTDAAEIDALVRLRSKLGAINADLKFQRLLRTGKKYSPTQPRDEAGRWTDNGGGDSARVRLAASDKPRLGPMAVAKIASQLAQRAIEAFRSENGLRDLFGGRIGTVSMTTIDGETVFGSNSTSPTYSNRDYREAVKLRDTLLEKYPDVMKSDNIGQKPNDAIFHAETNVLLRAARQKWG